MNPACVCLPHNAGLCSLINNVITCLELYEYVHVDWDHPRCMYGNAWPHLFQSNAHPQELGLPFDVIEEYPNYKYTGGQMSNLYRSDQQWRRDYRAQWEKLEVKDAVYGIVLAFLSRMPSNFIAVQVRSEPHSREQATGQPQTKEQYEDALRTVMKQEGVARIQNVYMMASDTVALNWFPGVRFYAPTVRTDSRSVDDHMNRKQTVQDAVNALVEVLIVSHAKAFIHPVSNMATCALGINPDMRSVYLS